MNKLLTAYVMLFTTQALFSSNYDHTIEKKNKGDEKRKEFYHQTTNDSVDYLNFNRRFIPYVKIGPDVMGLGKGNLISPALGFGFRSESNQNAVDISFSYSSREVLYEDDKRTISQAFFPKVAFHSYFSPNAPSSIYFGFGGSWGYLRNILQDKKFNGIYGGISLGYETGRDSVIRQVLQLDIDQPLLAYSQKGSLSTPSLEIFYILGF